MNISTRIPATKIRLAALTVAALLCLMTLFGVGSASAHDELVATTPTSGEVLKASPKNIVLTFSGDLKEIGTIINLKDSQGQAVENSFKIERRDLTITPAAALPNGEYNLVTRVVSSDGHPIDKKLSFSVADPKASATPEATKSAVPEVNPAPSAAPTAENTVAPVDQSPAGTFAGLPAALVWIIGGLVAIGLVATILVRFRRQGK